MEKGYLDNELEPTEKALNIRWDEKIERWKDKKLMVIDLAILITAILFAFSL